MTTAKSGTYEIYIKMPTGQEYTIAYRLSEDDIKNTKIDWYKLLSGRIAYHIEQLIRDETSEQHVARIEKEYEEKLNAV